MASTYSRVVEFGENTAYPTGRCYCGCQQEVPAQAFWIGGHDKRVISLIIAEQYGNAANFTLAHNRGPDSL